MSESFFNSGLIIDDFKVKGKVPVVVERFTIERIVGYIALEIFFFTVVGTGSRSQYESDDWESTLSISSKVAGVKEWNRGGVKVEENELGWKRGWFVGLKFYQRSMWQIAVVGQPEGTMWVGNDLQFCVGCY